jgi:acyl-CoA reductase-like NAD-dependent aldehyde dehydrogenase
MDDEYRMYVDGEFGPAKRGDTIETVNPATEEPLATVPAGTEADVDRAVAAANDALDGWKRMEPAKRGRLLSALADAIRDDADRLARIETLDNGKPLSQAAGDVEGAARYFEYYAGVADKVQGESIPLSEEYVDYTVREPLGVTGQIIPWNLPINILGRSVAPALASGNVSVVKPAEQTPLTAVEVARLADEVGLPPGVFNVVTGYGPEAGAALAGHTDVDGISFTGSVPTGRSVGKAAVENVTEVHLELGGKSPNVVFPDADVEAALDGTVTGIFGVNAGQVCSAGSRLLVHESIHEDFVDRLVDRVEDLTLGPGVEDPDVGPLVSAEQFETVTEYLDIGREAVGDPVVGGGTPDRPGYFVEPTVFDAVDNDSPIAQEEIFGPVLTVVPFADEAEAIELANDVDYGLVAGVFTTSLGRAHRFAREVEAGQIYVNEWFAGGVETPFGGRKQSGFGREKGLEAIESYTTTKNVCLRIE